MPEAPRQTSAIPGWLCRRSGRTHSPFLAACEQWTELYGLAGTWCWLPNVYLFAQHVADMSEQRCADHRTPTGVEHEIRRPRPDKSSGTEERCSRTRDCVGSGEVVVVGRGLSDSRIYAYTRSLPCASWARALVGYSSDPALEFSSDVNALTVFALQPSRGGADVVRTTGLNVTCGTPHTVRGYGLPTVVSTPAALGRWEPFEGERRHNVVARKSDGTLRPPRHPRSSFQRTLRTTNFGSAGFRAWPGPRCISESSISTPSSARAGADGCALSK